MAFLKIQRNSTGSQWRRLKIGDACVFAKVCNNPGKCVLNTLQFAHVDSGQTPIERVAVIKVTTQQGISHQDSSLINQVLSNPPEIKNLNEHVLQILRT